MLRGPRAPTVRGQLLRAGATRRRCSPSPSTSPGAKALPLPVPGDAALPRRRRRPTSPDWQAHVVAQLGLEEWQHPRVRRRARLRRPVRAARPAPITGCSSRRTCTSTSRSSSPSRAGRCSPASTATACSRAGAGRASARGLPGRRAAPRLGDVRLAAHALRRPRSGARPAGDAHPRCRWLTPPAVRARWRRLRGRARERAEALERLRRVVRGAARAGAVAGAASQRSPPTWTSPSPIRSVRPRSSRRWPAAPRPRGKTT